MIDNIVNGKDDFEQFIAEIESFLKINTK